MPNDTASADFESRLETAKAEGMAGREELLERLARMPMDKVIALPASSLAILGSQGLAQLAARREELAGTGRQHLARIVKAQPSIAGKSNAAVGARPLRSTAFLVFAILTIGLLADLSRPAWVPAIFDPGVRSRQTSRWPTCRRLNRHVDGCLYTARGANLSLWRVASLTGIAVDQVVTANRHLSIAPEAALPRGSRIVVWRGRQKLLGVSQ